MGWRVACEREGGGYVRVRGWLATAAPAASHASRLQGGVTAAPCPVRGGGAGARGRGRRRARAKPHAGAIRALSRRASVMRRRGHSPPRVAATVPAASTCHAARTLHTHCGPRRRGPRRRPRGAPPPARRIAPGGRRVSPPPPRTPHTLTDALQHWLAADVASLDDGLHIARGQGGLRGHGAWGSEGGERSARRRARGRGRGGGRGMCVCACACARACVRVGAELVGERASSKASKE